MNCQLLERIAISRQHKGHEAAADIVQDRAGPIFVDLQYSNGKMPGAYFLLPDVIRIIRNQTFAGEGGSSDDLYIHNCRVQSYMVEDTAIVMNVYVYCCVCINHWMTLSCLGPEILGVFQKLLVENFTHDRLSIISQNCVHRPRNYREAAEKASRQIIQRPRNIW